jgi:ABC-type dipeptide/oligopeptide/nickel transport system permease component
MLQKQEGKTFSANKTEQYLELKKRWGLNKPLFYISIRSPYSKACLDTLSKQEAFYCEALCNEFKNIEVGNYVFNRISRIIKTQSNKNYNEILELYNGNFYAFCKKVKNQYNLLLLNDSLKQYLISKQNNTSFLDISLPVIQWNGLDNQFHHWLKNLLNLNFGYSYTNHQNVNEVLFPALINTLWLCVISLFFSFAIAMPIGIFLTVKNQKFIAKLITQALFLINSFPTFWIATLLVIYLASGEYYSIFPAFGLGDLPPQAPFIDRLIEKVYHTILPVICYSLSIIAIIARQMQESILQNLQLDYVRTALAKGLSFRQVIWRHIFKNSVIPILAFFTTLLPHLLSSSVVLEYIFSISGIGKLLLDSLYARNYPILFAIVLISSLITLIGNLISDFVMLKIDPRITLHKLSM